MNPVKDFADGAKGLAKNPLGIIALFIVLVYGFAALVVGASSQLESRDQHLMAWFLVVFPFLVLVVFTVLVAFYHGNLYAPSDFRDDDSFLKAANGIQAAFAIGLATGKSDQQSELSPQDSLAAVNTITRATAPSHNRPSRKPRVLWVDDRPENNVYERQALEALGYELAISTSTEDALSRLGHETFDAIISDMGRPPDARAGYTLLDALRGRNDKTPFFIYAGSRSPEHTQEAQQHGAQGSTNRPAELIEMITSRLS